MIFWLFGWNKSIFNGVALLVIPRKKLKIQVFTHFDSIQDKYFCMAIIIYSDNIYRCNSALAKFIQNVSFNVF
jgi:hypothetical protein